MPVNFVHEEGNLTRDPEPKAIPGGNTVLKFSIAQTQRKKDASGQWVDGDTSFFDVEFWPQDPAYWLKRLGKGVGVVVDGELKQDRWEKDGQQMSRVFIKATNIVPKWFPELSATAAPASSAPNDPPF